MTSPPRQCGGAWRGDDGRTRTGAVRVRIEPASRPHRGYFAAASHPPLQLPAVESASARSLAARAYPRFGEMRRDCGVGGVQLGRKEEKEEDDLKGDGEEREGVGGGGDVGVGVEGGAARALHSSHARATPSVSAEKRRISCSLSAGFGPLAAAATTTSAAASAAPVAAAAAAAA